MGTLLSCHKNDMDPSGDMDDENDMEDTTMVVNLCDSLLMLCNLDQSAFVTFSEGSWWQYESQFYSSPLVTDSIKEVQVVPNNDTQFCKITSIFLEEKYMECDGVIHILQSSPYTTTGQFKYKCFDINMELGDVYFDTIPLAKHPTDKSAMLIVKIEVTQKDSLGTRIFETFDMVDDGTLDDPFSRSTLYKQNVGIVKRERTLSRGVHRVDYLRDYYIEIR